MCVHPITQSGLCRRTLLRLLRSHSFEEEQMVYNRLVFKTRIFSVCLVIVAAALAIASISLLTYTPGLAAPAPILASTGATVYGPLKEVCLVPSNSLAQLNTLQSNSVDGCTVSTAASSPALNAAKSTSSGSSDVNPLSFSAAALESMSWRNATQGSSLNPLSFSVAARESMSWRLAITSQGRGSR